MLDSNVARQIADLNTQIADTELQILQKQKRVENLLAKGADATEEKSAIAVLSETLARVESRKKSLEK